MIWYNLWTNWHKMFDQVCNNTTGIVASQSIWTAVNGWAGASKLEGKKQVVATSRWGVAKWGAAKRTEWFKMVARHSSLWTPFLFYLVMPLNLQLRLK